MGIVNATDDSYFYSSRVADVSGFISRVEKLVADGASIIDLGACSTRPGFTMVSEELEWERLKPLLEEYRVRFRDIPLSIDTFRSSIVRKAFSLLQFPFIVNDITSAEEDNLMLPTVVSLGLGYVAMHHKGTLETMHEAYSYDNIVDEVKEYFQRFGERAAAAGLTDYYIDPGFGFSKTIEDNMTLLENIGKLTSIGKPVLIGISRKSFIYKPLGLGPDSDVVLRETAKWHDYAADKGVSVLRVHEIC